MKSLFYDIEIINCIPTGQRDFRYKYCNGWQDYEGMGISVIGCCADWLTLDNQYKYFILDQEYWKNKWLDKIPDMTEKELDTLSTLEVIGQTNLLFSLVNYADNIIGFNSVSFDDKVLKANDIYINTTVDLYLEIKKALPYNNMTTKGKFNLDILSKTNLDTQKNYSGSLAPVLWQDKEYNKVIDYCLHDVVLLKQLFTMFINNELVNPNTGGIIKCLNYMYKFREAEKDIVYV
jgi:hypothetical protein